MMPVMFRIPGIGLEIPGYGVALMIGFIVSIFWAVRRAERSRANPDVILNCGFIALLGGVVGARAMYVYHYWPDYAAAGSPLRIFLSVIDVRKGGLEVYGGLIAVVVLTLLYLWWSRESIRWYLDIMAPSAALGMAVGRIGCFLNGCCFGGVCEPLPWAVRFPFGSPAAVQQFSDHVRGAGLPDELIVKREFSGGTEAMPLSREVLRIPDARLDQARQDLEAAVAKVRALGDRGPTTAGAERERLAAQSAALAAKFDPVTWSTAELMSRHRLSAAELKARARQHPALPVHPTQFYSAITLGLLALLLNALYWRRTRDGQVILTMLLIEPWTRWLLELVRADNPVDTLGTFTVSQFLAICLSAVGLLGLFALRWLPPRSKRARPWEPPAEPPTTRQKRKPARA